MQKKLLILSLLLSLSIVPLKAQAGFWGDVWEGVTDVVGGTVSWVGEGLDAVGEWISGEPNGSRGYMYSGSSSSASVSSYYNAGYESAMAANSERDREIKGILSSHGVRLDNIDSRINEVIAQNGRIQETLSDVLGRVQNLEDRTRLTQLFLEKSVEDGIRRDVVDQVLNDADELVRQEGDLAVFYKKQIDRVNAAQTDYEKQLRLQMLHEVANRSLKHYFDNGSLADQNAAVLAFEKYKSDLESFFETDPNLFDQEIVAETELSLSYAQRDRIKSVKKKYDDYKSQISPEVAGWSEDTYESRLNRQFSRSLSAISGSDKLEELLNAWREEIKNPGVYLKIDRLEKQIRDILGAGQFSDSKKEKIEKLFALSRREIIANSDANNFGDNADKEIARLQGVIDSIEKQQFEKNIKVPCEMLLENKVAEVRSKYFELKSQIVLNKLGWAYFDTNDGDNGKQFADTINKILKSNEYKDEARQQQIINGLESVQSDLDQAILSDLLTQMQIYQRSKYGADNSQKDNVLNDNDIKFLLLMNEMDPEHMNLAGFASMINSGYAQTYNAKNTDSVAEMINKSYKDLIALDGQLKEELKKNNCDQYYKELNIPSCFVQVNEVTPLSDQKLIFDVENIEKYITNTNEYFNPNEDEVYSNLNLGLGRLNLDYSNEEVASRHNPYPTSTRPENPNAGIVEGMRLARNSHELFDQNTNKLREDLDALIAAGNPHDVIDFLKNGVSPANKNGVDAYLSSRISNLLKLDFDRDDFRYINERVEGIDHYDLKKAGHLLELLKIDLENDELPTNRTVFRYMDNLNASPNEYEELRSIIEGRTYSEDYFQNEVFRNIDSTEDYQEALASPKYRQRALQGIEEKDRYKVDYVTAEMAMTEYANANSDSLRTSLLDIVVKETDDADELMQLVRDEGQRNDLSRDSMVSLLEKVASGESTPEDKAYIKEILPSFIAQEPSDISYYYSALERLDIAGMDYLVQLSEVADDPISRLPASGFFDNDNAIRDLNTLTENFDGDLSIELLSNVGLASTEGRNSVLTSGTTDTIEKYLTATKSTRSLSGNDIRSVNAFRVGLKTKAPEQIEPYLNENRTKINSFGSQGQDVSGIIADLPSISEGMSTRIFMQIAKDLSQHVDTDEEKAAFRSAIFAKLDVINDSQKRNIYKRIMRN